MKIAILGYTATSYGSLTYLRNLLPQLAQLDRSNTYEIFVPARQAPELAVDQPNFHFHLARTVPRSGLGRVVWEQLILPWIIWRKRIEAVYTTHNLAILLARVPSVTLIQNVEPFFLGEFPSPPRLRARLVLLRLLSTLSLRRSAHIVAISDWERDFLVERLRVPQSRITVAYPGASEGFRPAGPDSARRLHERLGLVPPYLLSASRLTGYGNLLNLAKAFATLVKRDHLAMPLVVPGEVWDKGYVSEVLRFLRREGCAEQVKFLGYIPHQDIALLMANATCFLFPSLLEACGNVLLEALACGTPIACCNRRPMTDICGEAAVYFDGEDPADMAAKISAVLGDAPLREALKCHGLERAREFSWRRNAEAVRRVFEQLESGLPIRVGDAADVSSGSSTRVG